jgi:hypothetical protein
LNRDARAARREHDSLQFDAQCLALQRNDAATTRVVTTDQRDGPHPERYAVSRLGEALQNNTRVEQLDVHVKYLVPSSLDAQQALSAMGPLLRYIRTNKTLRRGSMSINRPVHDVNKLLADEALKAFFANQGKIDELTLGSYVPVTVFCKSIQC